MCTCECVHMCVYTYVHACMLVCMCGYVCGGVCVSGWVGWWMSQIVHDHLLQLDCSQLKFPHMVHYFVVGMALKDLGLSVCMSK